MTKMRGFLIPVCCNLFSVISPLLSSVVRHLSSVLRPPSSVVRHPTRSGALTQPGQDLDTGIAVGGSHADFSLEITHRALGIATDPAVAPAASEATLGQAALHSPP